MRPVRFLLASLALFSICSIAAAQNYVPTQPDNTLTPADPMGIPPQPTGAGTHEAVNNTNGGLSFFLPVLSLPQRGGWNLTLGYHNTSPSWFVRQNVSVTVNENGSVCGAPKYTYPTYNDNIQPYPLTAPLMINLPTLQASIEYTGDAQVRVGSTCTENPVLCLTNWVFTDWSGNRHSFSNVTICSVSSGYGAATTLAQVTDSSDGSWLRLDTSNYSSAITVRTKDGTTYTFPGFGNTWPYPPCGASIQCSTTATTNSSPWYNSAFSSMADTNGNTLHLQPNSGGPEIQCGPQGGCTLTDTIGRTITIGGAVAPITYKDSNGNAQTVSVTSTQQTAQNYNLGTFSCNDDGNIPANVFVTVHNGTSSFTKNPYAYTVTLPPVNGTSRVYQLQFDGLSNLVQASYPAGGYTKYNYQNTSYSQTQGLVQCQQPQQQVAQKRECPLSSGACSSSQELVTTYTPSPDFSVPFNDNMTVTDPLGDVTYVVNQNSDTSFTFVAPHETSRKIFPPGQYPTGTQLRTVVTTYTPYVTGFDLQVPAQVTTTLNDISPSISAVTNYQYQTVPITVHCINPGICALSGTQVAISNPTEVDEYDYGASSPTKKTAQTWMTTSNGSLYDIAGGHLLDRLATRTITDPVTNVQSTLSYGYNSVGDITSKNVAGTNVSPLTTSYQRDSYGNITQLTDPKGNITNFGYTDTWAQTTCAPPSNSSAYLTSITDALNHVTNFSNNSCTGSKASVTDPNGLNTSFSYDALARMIQTNFPDGGQTSTSYVDAIPNTSTTTTLINTSLLSRVSKTILDGFARTIQIQLTSDPQGTVYTDTTYDALGRVSTVSNPYRTGGDPTTTTGTTTYAYDALSRKISETYPDNSILTTAYCGASTLVTDPTGRWRRSRVDGLGRLVEVDEPNALGATVASTGCPGTGEPIWVTSYTNDALGNLTQVVQNGSHQRNFTYDSLSRLLTSSNPETSTITYKYDSDTNCSSPNSFPTLLVSKTDARGIRTCAQYDALNRITQKSYSDAATPTAFFAYDGTSAWGVTLTNTVGRLVAQWTGTSCCVTAGAEIFSYDPMGRVLLNEQYTPAMGYRPVNYTYDLAGNTTSITYPSGRIVNYTFDSASRTKTAADGSNGIIYATEFQTPPSGCLSGAVCYTPQGTFYALSIGQSSSFTGLNLTHSYNNRLQPLEFKASSSGGNAIDINYSFVDPSTSKNAGHVYSIANNLDSSRSQTFSYDQLNRITSALTTSTYATSPTHCWGENYAVDAWGNLQSIVATTNPNYTGCSQESGFSATPDGNNHLNIFSYDSSGNTQNDGVNSYTWDAESQLSATAGVTYAYDAQGRRVSKSTGKNYVYGLGGEIVAETDGSGNTTAEYIFFGGKRVAMLPAGGNPIYYIEDLLGTSRVLTDASGVVCYEADFYPYGGERSYTNTCPQNYKFEGKERDTETGNDDFGARYYSNRFGRWLSADWSAVPAPVPYANLTNPQTLNLYSMVSDDPESFADLDGHCCEGALEAGEQIFEGHTLAEKIIGGVIIAGAVIGTVLSNPDVRDKVTDVIERTAAGNTTTPGPYVGPIQAVDQQTKQEVKNDANGKCEYCGQTTQDAQKSQKGVTPPGNEGQTDHYKPSSKGGTDDKSNLAHSCRNCNGAKSDADPTNPNDAAGKKWQLDRMQNQQQQPPPSNPQPPAPRPACTNNNKTC